jgi:uncharacterized repeat protein (TIGR03943 family)
MSSLATFVFCAVALVLPVQTLSSRAALTREQSNFSTDEIVTSSFSEFSTDYRNLTISEWSSLLAKQPPIEEIEDKTAQIEGFALFGTDEVSIARFRIACCSVDATPLTIQVSDEAANQLTPNQWYILEGTFTQENGDYILNPTSVTPIEEPENPYVF